MAKLNLRKAAQLIQTFVFWEGCEATNIKTKMSDRHLVNDLDIEDVECVMGGGVVIKNGRSYWARRRFKEKDNSDLIYSVMMSLEPFSVSYERDGEDLTIFKQVTLEVKKDLTVIFELSVNGVEKVDYGDWENAPESTIYWEDPNFSDLLIIKKGEEVEITEKKEVSILKRELKRFMNYEH